MYSLKGDFTSPYSHFLLYTTFQIVDRILGVWRAYLFSPLSPLDIYAAYISILILLHRPTQRPRKALRLAFDPIISKKEAHRVALRREIRFHIYLSFLIFAYSFDFSNSDLYRSLSLRLRGAFSSCCFTCRSYFVISWCFINSSYFVISRHKPLSSEFKGIS